MNPIPTVIPRLGKPALKIIEIDTEDPVKLLANNFKITAQQHNAATTQPIGNFVSGEFIYDIEHFVKGTFDTLKIQNDKIQQFIVAYINSAVMHGIIPPYSETIAEYLCIFAKVAKENDCLGKFVKLAGFNLLVLDETANRIKYITADGIVETTETIVLVFKDGFYPADKKEFANREWYAAYSGLESLSDVRNMFI